MLGFAAIKSSVIVLGLLGLICWVALFCWGIRRGYLDLYYQAQERKRHEAEKWNPPKKEKSDAN